MDIEDCNGRAYIPGSGDSSLEKEFTSAIVGPAVSTPNSQHSSPSRSLSANSIKVEMYSDEESSRLLSQDERMLEKEDSVIVEDSLSEPLGYCDGAGPEPHSPGGIRLPNGKLKCDICGMVCIGPNVLMVHKRSHTGEVWGWGGSSGLGGGLVATDAMGEGWQVQVLTPQIELGNPMRV
ncbi:zinc finger protein Eos-like [Pitangus sulphuratus]|nr:zinc finger protein Eos-like [Pitangus sulphuratus]